MAQGFPYKSATIQFLDRSLDWRIGVNGVSEIKLLPMGAFVMLIIEYAGDAGFERYMLTPDKLVIECGDPIEVAEPSGPKLVVPTNQLRPELS